MNVILKGRRNVARLKEDGIRSSKCVAVTQEFTLMSKWHMKHELLMTVLLKLGAMWVRRAEWPDDNYDLLPPVVGL